MIAVQTIADIYCQRYTLGLYCMHCERWGEANLEQMIRGGSGDRLLARTRFRCRDCGAAADKQLRPPVPTRGGAIAYIQPRHTGGL